MLWDLYVMLSDLYAMLWKPKWYGMVLNALLYYEIWTKTLCIQKRSKYFDVK